MKPSQHDGHARDIPRWVDWLAAVTLLSPTLSLAIRTEANGFSQRFGSVRGAYLVYLCWAGAAALLMLVISRRSWRRFAWVARVPVWPLAMVLVSRVYGPLHALALGGVFLVATLVHARGIGRGAFLRSTIVPVLLVAAGAVLPTRRLVVPREDVPSHHGEPHDRLSKDDLARWALRLALHASTAGDSDSVMNIPPDWPYPESAEVAMTRSASGIRLLAARIPGSGRVCTESLGVSRRVRGFTSDWLECRDERASDRSLPFGTPPRRPRVSPPVSGGAGSVPWSQYRGNAQRSGSVRTPGSIASWSADLEAGARASASIAGDLALIGTHGGGSLEAFRLEDGASSWRIRVPNWIHQDAVTDGRIVVLGFGDNGPGKYGNLPSGVSAYDRRTGRLLWTQFEASSVMTSPVIHEDGVSYITLDGVMRIRGLESGAERATIQLAGGAVMGPPLLRNDTLIAALEPNNVCAVDVSAQRQLWCASVPELDWLGRAAAALFGDTVIVSGPTVESPTSWRWNITRLLNVEPLEMVAAAPWFGGGGHRVRALHARTGQLLWSSRTFPVARFVAGHSSGTATADDSVIVVNLPFADRVVGFDRRTGAERWSIAAGNSRGPVLLADGRVYLTTGTGRIVAIDALDGTVRCDVKVPRRFDRAGPALAGTALLIASIEGDLVSLNRAVVDRCDRAAIASAFRPWR